LAEDAVASYTDSLHVEARQDGTEVTVIVVEGSLDQHSSASDRACVDEAVGTRPGSVAVDARGLTFCQCSGLAALLRARHAATEAGVAFRVSDASPGLRHVAELAGFQALLPDDE
jgi:anti-sigma B factor antagonist